jgi:hypothetical protein
LPRYRIYFLDPHERVERKFFIWSENDERVISLVRRLEHAGGVEIYQDSVLLARLDGERLTSIQ